jgi:hypothetical protein
MPLVLPLKNSQVNYRPRFQALTAGTPKCLSAHVLSARRLDDLTRRVIQPGAADTLTK